MIVPSPDDRPFPPPQKIQTTCLICGNKTEIEPEQGILMHGMVFKGICHDCKKAILYAKTLLKRL